MTYFLCHIKLTNLSAFLHIISFSGLVLFIVLPFTPWIPPQLLWTFSNSSVNSAGRPISHHWVQQYWTIMAFSPGFGRTTFATGPLLILSLCSALDDEFQSHSSTKSPCSHLKCPLYIIVLSLSSTGLAMSGFISGKKQTPLAAFIATDAKDLQESVSLEDLC